MKRFIAFILILSALMLCGCQLVGHKQGELRLVEELSLPLISSQESRAMAGYMCSGRACIYQNRLYCLEFDSELQPVLGSYSINEQGLGDFRVIKRDCVPEFLTAFDGRLYYINSRSERPIESVDIESGESTVIIDGPCDFLRLYSQQLYYCDSRMRLCRCSPDGSGQQLIMPEACFYPYVSGDRLIYQRASNERLYIRNLTTGAEEQLTDFPAYGPVLAGERLYCTAEDGIFSMSLRGMEPKKFQLEGIQGAVEYELSDEALILRGVMENGGLRDWSFNAETPDSFSAGEQGCYSRLELAGEEYTVRSCYEAGGRLKYFVITDSQGDERKFFAGETL